MKGRGGGMESRERRGELEMEDLLRNHNFLSGSHRILSDIIF